MASPPAAYQGPALDVDQPFYRRLAEEPGREPVAAFEVPIRSGRAWRVPRGHLCRLSTVEGPQVGDLNLWHADDPRERFWAARTRQLQRAHVSTFDRLWSTLPFLRPLATITSDTLAGHGVDGDGGRVHDLLGTRCDPYVNRLLTGEDFDFHCHSNLVRAVAPFGLTEFDVHDVLNVFQCTGLNAVQGAVHAGAKYVVAVDPVEFKREAALKFGATHAFATAAEAAEKVNELTWGQLADQALITVGTVDEDVVTEAFDVVGKGGTVVITGLANPEKLTVHLSGGVLTLFEKTVKGTLFGSANPQYDIVRLLRLYDAGKLKLDELVTRKYTLDQINEGYQDLRDGKNIRGVIVHE